MSDYLSLRMVEQEYTGAKLQKNMIFTFPEVPYKATSIMPDSFNLPAENTPATPTSKNLKTVIGDDGRLVIPNPHRLEHSQGTGRIDAIYVKENSDIVIKHATAFSFAPNWIMTTATNVYDSSIQKFPDKIIYYPGLGGNIDSPPYGPVNITNAFVHPTMLSAASTSQEIFNIAFLKLDEAAPKPEGYYGFRYQLASYEGEGSMLFAYANDLPADADALNKGTYMYKGMAKISRNDVNFLYHQGDTSKGSEGAPMAIYWGDSNGWVVIGMNAYQESGRNVGIRINRQIYGAMKMIREGGMADVAYAQPSKPDNSTLPPVTNLFDDIKLLGELYHQYYVIKNESLPDIKAHVIGICNFLRQIKYSDIVWAASLLDPIDTSFISYVKENDLELFNRLSPYINESSIKDSGNGVIDLAHFAATLEGYTKILPTPDFWTGWGGDLASGMSNTSTILNENYTPEQISNYIITKTAFDTIGNTDSKCNFSDFCSDFDAIRISQIISEKATDETYSPTPGHELAEIMEMYYNTLYLDRFTYILSDLDCTADSDLETIYNAILTKMTGPDEAAILLTTIGENPSKQVIDACCKAFANYILKEI